MPDSVAVPPRPNPNSEVALLLRRIEELETQLAQAQKMHAIGSLAGGVAHDFNNLLTAILGYVSLLREEPSASPQVVEALDVIEKAADRAGQLTAQILGFTRRGTPKRVRIDVHQVLSEVNDLLRHTIDKSIRLETSYHSGQQHVLGDSGQLFQVFLNLAVNARDAMNDGGILRLETRAQDQFLRVSVIDTGTGIPQHLRERIFEPFFTTKESGKGTGMGLTVVTSIVRAHGGRIEIENEIPHGTRFHVLLPLASERAKELPLETAAAPSRGKGSVLVVDDEEVVRQVAARMLNGLGYHAICLGSALEAVEYYKKRARDIDVVLVDLIMPDLSGKDLFQRLIDINPKVRVLLSSGYNQDAGIDALIEGGAKGFLQKPYRLAQLSESLASALKA